jgi:YegS/Rv2252/BmrU family lipid kinase
LKLFYLNNPACNNGKGKKVFSSIIKILNARKIEYDSIQTAYAGHATEIIKTLNFSDYDALVVSGGDGTLFEVINGYLENHSTKRIPIGIIPAGRGNAFARDINLFPEEYENAIDAVVFGNTKYVDVGFCKTKNQKFYFINIIGLGFVTDVAKTAFKLRAFGHLSYILGVFYRTLSLKPFPLKIEIDGKMYERENVFVEFSNTRYTGKDFLMAPDAIIDDGMLDITLLNKVSRLGLLQALPKIFTGSHVKMKEVECFRGRRIKVEAIPNKDLTPDGQIMESTPIEVECLLKAIEVFVK